jgi:thymidylate kinase
VTRNPICFVGIDGSGKTTLALRLVTELEKADVKCRYVWFREPYFLSLPFLALCRLVGLTKIRHRGLSVFREHNFRTRPLAAVWEFLQFLDAWSLNLIKIRLPMLLGHVVICDRYIHDILVDMAEDTGDVAVCSKTVGRLLTALVPRSAIVFLVDVQESKAFRRKLDIPDMKYLEARRRAYHTFIKLPNVRLFSAEGGSSASSQFVKKRE